MLVETLSASKLTAYLRCPRQFELRYIAKLPRESRSTAACFGTAVHTAVAWWQHQCIDGHRPSAVETAAVFGADWTAEWAVGDLDLGSRTAKEWSRLGTQLVELFINEVGVVPDEVDCGFEVPLIRHGRELEVPLVGFYDYVIGGTIGEIKTTARRCSPSQWWLQLAAYSYARAVMRHDPTLQVVMLVKTRTPSIEVVEHRVSEEDLGRFLDVAQGVLRAVESGVFPPNPGWTCGTCEYRAACRRMTLGCQS